MIHVIATIELNAGRREEFLAEFRKLVWAVDVRKLSRDEGFRHDLAFAVHELKRIHFSPFRAASEAEIDSLAAALHAEIPKLNDDQICVRMMAVIRQFGDGHTLMMREQPSLPVTFFVFPEGLHVLGAAPQHADLVGAKVLKIAGKGADEAVAMAETLVARDRAKALELRGDHQRGKVHAVLGSDADGRPGQRDLDLAGDLLRGHAAILGGMAGG